MNSQPLTSFQVEDWSLVLITLFVMSLVLVACYTLYQTHHYVKKHNVSKKMLHKMASDNIRTQRLTKMLLRKTHSFPWRVSKNAFILSDDLKQFLGVEQTEMSVGDLFDTSEFYQQKLRSFMALNYPGQYTVQFYGAFRNHSPHWYELRMSVAYTRDGIQRTGAAIMIDHIKRREAMELDTNRMLANAKEKENFISCMSHEIRTPLNAIVGLAQLLADPSNELSDIEVDLFKNEINKNNVQLMKMIEDMLTITLIDNSSTVISMKPLRLAECCEELLNLNGEDSVLLYGSKIIIDDNLEDLSVMIDHTFFMRIVENLVGNAAKFSPEGAEIALGWRTAGEDVVFYVRDEGIGMDEQYHQLIFSRFYKIDPYSQGAGLGLALSKELADRMDASFSIRSKRGEGSTFRLRMKRAS